MLYLITNGAMPTTAAFAGVATGTSIKTLLQVKPFNLARVVEWGISFDGFAAALPGKVELIETDVAATVTASVDADITKFGPNVADGAAPPSPASRLARRRPATPPQVKAPSPRSAHSTRRSFCRRRRPT